MIASRVNFSLPSRWCASRGALMRTPTSSTICSISARGSPGASMGSWAPISSTMSARVKVGLSMCAAISVMRARSSALRWCVRRSARAARCASRSRCRPRASARHCALSSAHDSDSGLVGAGRFLRGGQLRGGGFAVDDDEVVARPFAQPGRALRPRFDAVGVDAGDLGHPGVRIDGVEFEAAFGVQQVAQGGLVDDAGGFGLVVEAFGVQLTRWPSARGWRLGTMTWVCRCGSPHRDVSCW